MYCVPSALYDQTLKKMLDAEEILQEKENNLIWTALRKRITFLFLCLTNKTIFFDVILLSVPNAF